MVAKEHRTTLDSFYNLRFVYSFSRRLIRRTARYLASTLCSCMMCVFGFCISIICCWVFFVLTECGSCYLINMESVIGIIASDIILTIFITISVFCFATHQRRKREWESHSGEHCIRVPFFTCVCLPSGVMPNGH